MRSSIVTLVGLALIVGCSPTSTESPPTVAGPGAESPEQAVERLRESLLAGDFEAAGSLGVPGQAVLASLAEGATPAEVVSALDAGGVEVAANFWSGFAQGAGAMFEEGAVVEVEGTVAVSGIEFTRVSLTTESGGSQVMFTRMVDGHRIDIFASFGSLLAGRLASSVELLLGSSTAEAKRVLGELQDVVPSLSVAATDGRLSPQAAQEILQLIELITRVG